MGKNPGFLLKDLIGSLAESRASLVIEVRDPSSLSNTRAITGARAIDLAQEDELTFCKKESPELVSALSASKSRFMIARPEIVDMLPDGFTDNRVLILSEKPRLLLACLLGPFESAWPLSTQRERIHPLARIASNVQLGPGVVIGADVEIGSGCIIGPNTAITHATIGEECLIGYNCSIGHDGFGFEIDDDTGEVLKFPHFGRVVIGCRVEVLSNTCIARGSLRDTVIEDDVKIDTLVHVAHNCHIKRGAFLISHSMIGGSTTVGEYAWLAPCTAVMNNISVGRCTMTGMAAAVLKSVGDNELIAGVPARKLRNRFRDDFPLLKD